MVITLSEEDYTALRAVLSMAVNDRVEVLSFLHDRATEAEYRASPAFVRAERMHALFSDMNYGEEHEKQEGQYLSSDGGSDSRDGGTDTGDSPSA